jgi:hypothetical protein
MDFQLVTDYRNMQVMLHCEIRDALSTPQFRHLLHQHDPQWLMITIETTWLKDCIESTLLLMFQEDTAPTDVYKLIHQLDKQNLLRTQLYRKIKACNHHLIPEGELTLMIRPSGLYLYL